MLKKRQSMSQMMNGLSNLLTTAETEPGMSLTAEPGNWKTKMKQFPALQLRILIEKRWRGSSSTLHISLSTDQREFQEIGRRGSTHEKATTSNQSCKDAYTTYDQS